MQRFSSDSNYPKIWILGIAALAIALRLVWPWDMEWKADEKLMHQLAADAANSGVWPKLGMDSGVGLKNAGFSVWPFALLYLCSQSPITMVLFVMVCNVLALFIMYHCSQKMGSSKPYFLAGLALVGVNVLMVVFSRKIWAQDLLPLFMATIWYLHIHRNKTIALFFLGVLLALAGQLHISGFFYGAGLFFAMLLAGEIRWRSFFLLGTGFLLGMLPAIGWLKEIMGGTGTSNTSLANVFKFEYWIHAVLDPMGINLQYSLGKDLFKMLNFSFFLPVVAAVAILAVTIVSAISIFKSGTVKWSKPNFSNPMVFYGFAFVLIPGLLLTLSGSPVRSHYLIAAAPFIHALFAKFWLQKGNKWLAVVLVSQAVIALCFLIFIHMYGAPNGDYGLPYRLQ